MDSGTLVEIALKLKMYDLWENRKWKAHLASIASNNYNFDELFGRALRLESSFQSLIDIMEIGILGINEQGAVFICNKKAETIVGRNLTDAIGQQAGSCFPTFLLRSAAGPTGKLMQNWLKSIRTRSRWAYTPSATTRRTWGSL